MSEWKTREDVRRLVIGKKELGRGWVGIVHVGRIWFKGQKPKRVAVKVFEPSAAEEFFKKPAFDEEVVKHYEEAIKRLRQAGVAVPKTGFVKHEEQWVQVQELFGASKKGSKITDIRGLNQTALAEIVQNEAEKRRLFDLVGKIINAEFIPHSDSIGIVQTKSGRRFIVHDLDFIAHIHFLQKRLYRDVFFAEIPNYLRIFVAKMQRAGMKRSEVVDELIKRVTNHNAVTAMHYL